MVEITLFDPDDIDECTVTARMARFSAPYVRLEIEPQRDGLGVRYEKAKTFVRTVSHARDADAVWFDKSEEALLAIEELPLAPTSSWRWLVVSLVAGALSLVALWLVYSALPNL